MNLTVILKRLSIIFALAVIISIIFTVMWIYLPQYKKNNSVISTLDSNVTDFTEINNDFNKILNNKSESYNNVNLKKLNDKDKTYGIGINDSLTKEDKETKLQNNNNNNNNNISKENINLIKKLVSIKDIDSTKINIKVENEIGDSEIKEDMILKIENKIIINDINKNLYFNNKSDQIMIITPTKLTLNSNLNNSSSNISNTLNNTDIQISEDNRKCYGELGCLSVLKTSKSNVFSSHFPLSRKTINTSVIFYTRDNHIKGQVIVVREIKTVERINFNPKRKTKFIINGFTSSPHESWVEEMKNEFLKHDDYNVIVLDWTKGNSIHIFYFQATVNTRLVGLEIAYLIKYLHTNYNLKLDDVHLIGHSLGAHIAGFVGEKLHGKIERISGLDPAKEFFEKTPHYMRLDFTDAKFVDVIHTSMDTFIPIGISQPCGHLDFYPNNGKNQPGCLKFTGLFCSHTRAVQLFTESINSKCQFIAHECQTYESFMDGKCFLCDDTNSANCGIMGYHADKSPALLYKLTVNESIIDSLSFQKFFIFTGDEFPYCRRHYMITIHLADPDLKSIWVQGFINVTFYRDNGIIHSIELTPNDNPIKLYNRITNQIIALSPENPEYYIGKIQKIELFWKALFCFFCDNRLYIDNIVVDIMELPPGWQKREIDFSSKFCSIQEPQKYTEIMSNSSAFFVDNCFL